MPSTSIPDIEYMNRKAITEMKGKNITNDFPVITIFYQSRTSTRFYNNNNKNEYTYSKRNTSTHTLKVISY